MREAGDRMKSREYKTATQYDDNFARASGPEWSWYALAACRGADPELFFPLGKVRPGDRQVAVAKGICGRCPVRDDCLSWVLDNPQDEGVWAGLDPVERRSFSRRHRRLKTVGGNAPVASGAPTRNATAGEQATA